ncbi:MAG: PEP-CTERM sorting domain-containing protein [Lentisphaeria bacterium]
MIGLVSLAVIPEPASLALLGLGGLFCLRRSRR